MLHPLKVPLKIFDLYNKRAFKKFRSYLTYFNENILAEFQIAYCMAMSRLLIKSFEY